MKSAAADILFRTSVTPQGVFPVALHRPRFSVINMREQERIKPLGHTAGQAAVDNRANFPAGDIRIDAARPIYEIANIFPFRGATYIDTARADALAADPAAIRLPEPPECSLRKTLQPSLAGKDFSAILADLPLPVLYGLAANSTDGEELVMLANHCSRIDHDHDGQPVGLRYSRDAGGNLRPEIDDPELFEAVANNPFLPDSYKEVMVLRPGAQGGSEIVGEWTGEASHVFEYLRSNSYIAGGHFAANMADDAIRYNTSRLSVEDMEGLRHLYYQRVYLAVAGKIGIAPPVRRRLLTADELEDLRLQIVRHAEYGTEKTATLWGWNYGYDLSASGYRLHASHQMIHQQYALVPERVGAADSELLLPSFSCGDLAADTVARYASIHGSDFFSDLLSSIRNNTRTDGKTGEHNLVVREDENVLLFVPKAQVSQWELQLLVIADGHDGPVGNILEADRQVRKSIDRGILTAQQIYARLNGRMVTSIEFSKRLGLGNGQRLLYSFLPKLPWAMGGFSEAQLRFISGHYPEDFARCCREQLIRLKAEGC